MGVSLRAATSRRRPRILAAGSLVLAALLAGCGGSALPSTASFAANAPANSASPVFSPPSPTTASSMPSAAVASVPAVATPPSTSLAALPLLWQKAGPSGTTTATYWPAVDPRTGNVWVTSIREDRFWIFSPAGKFLEAWGTPGKAPGQFTLRHGTDAGGAVAFAPDGSFFVVDGGNQRVEKFDAGRHFLKAWGSFGTDDGQFADPRGIATDGKTVYVADAARGDVQAFDANGRFLRSFPIPFVLFSLAQSGHLFVADQTGILELDGSGHQVAHHDLDFATLGGNDLEGGHAGSQTAVDRAGHIYVGVQSDAGPVALVELDPSGAILRSWSTGGETMALSPDGKVVYLAYTGPPTPPGWPDLRAYALPKP